MCEIEINSLLKQVIESENVINPKIKIEDTNGKGDGYMGVMTSIAVKGSNKTLNLIVKSAHKSEGIRKEAPVRDVFIREINFYMHVYPTLLKFQLECGDLDPFIKIAKCYAVCKRELEESLVFENLKVSGYTLFDRQRTMNEEHVTMVLEEYGKLHAMSYALREKNAELFQEVTQDMTDIIQEIFDNPHGKQMFDKIFNNIKTIPELANDEKILCKLNKYFDTYVDFLKSITVENADRYAVILHGDCWCNNMLFKYDSNGKPTSIRFIDWQVNKLGSPVLDLSYFIYTCTGKEIFNNLKKWLKMYHNSITRQLKKLGCGTDKITFEELERQWKKFAQFGFIMALMVIKIMLSDQDEVPDFVSAAENDKSIFDTFHYESKHEEQFKRRIADLVVHLVDNNFI